MSLCNVNPFEIPEILDCIAEYLSIRDITIVVKVSRVWYHHFTPYLWRQINIHEHNQFSVQSSLSKHANLVTSLCISNTSLKTDNLFFPCLRKLALFLVDEPFSNAILNRNPTIEELQIDSKGKSSEIDDLEFWLSISNLPRLRNLNLTDINVSPAATTIFWEVFCRLETADFSIDIQNSTIPDWINPSKLKSLLLFKMSISQKQTMELVRKCSGLECLIWHTYSLVEGFVNYLPQTSFPNLHDLCFLNATMDEYQLQQILKSVTRLTNFKYIAAPWGSESFNALSQHFETLVKLHLGNNVSFTSVMVHTVMSSCPNLKELTSREIKGLDIVHDNRINKDTRPDQGWICTRLRILAISLDLDGIDSQIPILERISSLTQLQKLNLRSNGETIFKLSLDCGLDILKPLKNLLEVEAWQSGANMTEEDIQWVFENWRKLKRFNCTGYCKYCCDNPYKPFSQSHASRTEWGESLS